MFNKGKPYVPPPTRSMGTASSHDELHDLDETELELENALPDDDTPLTLDQTYDHVPDDIPADSQPDDEIDEDVTLVSSSTPEPAEPVTPVAPQPFSGGGGSGSGGFGATGGSGSGGFGGGFGGSGSPPPSRPSREAASVLGTGMTFEGDISGVGQLVIEGTVKGDIRVSQVLINEKGAVEGTVHADVLDVRGRVTGAIVAKQVHLHPSSRVEGDITQEQLTIERGAWFSGRSTQAKRGDDGPAAES